MGQVVNMMKYDQAANLANAAPTPLSLNACPLVFHKLDDGVMGGSSITNIEVMNAIDGIILFSGEINTNGGGFASIRSPLDNSIPHDAKGIKLKVREREYVILSNCAGHSLNTHFTLDCCCIHSPTFSTKAMVKHTRFY